MRFSIYEEKEFIKKVNIDKAKNKTIFPILLMVLSLLTYQYVLDLAFLGYDYFFREMFSILYLIILFVINIDLSNPMHFKKFIYKYGLNIISSLDKSKDLPAYLAYNTKDFNTYEYFALFR